ncbi:MAG TPA: DUF4398 domain-containing protein [Steroidobacteraceae bacterium]|jgi:hypothetical protein|nr:DUF4398 domain-containing protein [Steroidobacteraceae bacterium]
MNTNSIIKTGTRLQHLLWCGMLLLAACTTTPPVQEMSDARQAVEAAIESGAAQTVPEKMSSAQAALKMAERLLRDHQFNAARYYAKDAKKKALDAQRLAQSRSGSAH